MFDNLAQNLFGAKRAESDSVLSDAGTNTIHGTAVTDSSNGAVMVELSSDVTNPDPIEVDGEMVYEDADISVELPTTENVKEGDEVLVSVLGNTPMRSPVVTGVVGSGDRIAADVEAAREIAEATGQHFWDADDGAHVTEVTREEWEDSTSPNYQSGPNSLWNSLGMLFRDGLTNLLAILTNGLAIYDGEGNTDDNIIARFTANLIRIGKLIVGPSSYDNIASIEFFDDNSELEVRQIANVDHSTVNRGMRLSSSLTDEDEYIAVGSIAESSNIDSATGTTAGLELTATVKKDYGSNVAASILLHAGKNSGTRRIELFSDWLVLDGSGAEYIRGTFTMQHVIDMLTTSTGTITRGSAASSIGSSALRKAGKVVSVIINDVKLASALASGSTSGTIATIPAGYRPGATARVAALLGTAGNFGNVWGVVGTGGNVVIANRSPTSIPTTQTISFCLVYIVT